MMIPKRIYYRTLGLWSLFVILMTACAGTPLQPLAPSISLTGFKVHKVDLFEQVYKLKLRVQNPNPFVLPLAGIEYALYLNDKEFVRRVNSYSMMIPAQGEHSLEIEVVSNLAQIFQQWQGWNSLLNQNFRYRLTGGIRLTEWSPLMPFDQQGEIALQWDK
jgi:LEA14-like dessication related protein